MCKKSLNHLLTICFIGLASLLFGQTENTISGKDAQLHYTIYGEGKPLLFINGGPGIASKSYAAIAKKLSKWRKVILYDQRGTGKSFVNNIDKHHVNMKAMVEDIELLRNHLNIESWDVMGQSFGGVLAMSYVAIHPNKVNSMILLSSGGLDNDFDRYVDQNIDARLTPNERAELERLRAMMSKKEYDPVNLKLVRAINARTYVYKIENIERATQRLCEELNQNPLISQLLWEEIGQKEFDLKPKLASFKNPVLIIHGIQDFIGQAVPIQIEQAFSNSKRMAINECGHFVWMDQPKAALKAIKGFLKAVD